MSTVYIIRLEATLVSRLSMHANDRKLDNTQKQGYNTVIIVYILSNTLNTLFLGSNRLALQSSTMDKIKEPSRSQVIISDTL